MLRVILLVATIGLLLGRVKGTPRMLSKELYRVEMRKALNSFKVSMMNDNKITRDELKRYIIVAFYILDFLFILYYSLIGSLCNSDILFVLSAIQILTVIITFKRSRIDSILNGNVNDFTFYRWYFLFNVILDYVYYSMSIYYLVIK